MKTKYLLIEVIERAISSPEFFNTYAEAHNAMMSKFKESLGLNDEDLTEAEPIKDVDGGFQIEEDCCFSKWKAYGECHGQNYDWEIFEV